MGPDQFVEAFVARLRSKAADLRAYGATDPAQTCDRNAQDLEESFQAWWLAELTVSEAAKESGYSEERLREMARTQEIPSRKGEGAKGHLTICRRDLPRRPHLTPDRLDDIGTRLLQKRQKRHLRPAS
jgi:hypothetical protein